MSYKGSFVQQLIKAFSNNPEQSIGEVLHEVIGKYSLGKHYFEASDEEIYQATEKFVKIGQEKEEPLPEPEFYFWVENRS